MPTIIINDGAIVKAEFSSGYGRTNFFGKNDSTSLEPGFGNNLYQYNFSGDNSPIVLNKLYLELFSDIATYTIGRHSINFGMGAMINSGENIWDRFSFTWDGISAGINISNFTIQPFWVRQGSMSSLTRSSRINEIGVAIKYNNIDTDLTFGFYYSSKKSSTHSTTFREGTNEDLPDPATEDYSSYTSLGKTNVKIIDIYLHKKYHNFQFGIEIPILNGEIGNLFGNNNVEYKTRAFLIESSYKASDKFTFNLNFGNVPGHDGSDNKFSAMYLNPNYQIASLLFRYNLRAIANPMGTNARNVYDSYIHNANYIKCNVQYKREHWTWNLAYIWARANQVAEANKSAYNHLTNKIFTATQDQEKTLGK